MTYTIPFELVDTVYIQDRKLILKLKGAEDLVFTASSSKIDMSQWAEVFTELLE